MKRWIILIIMLAVVGAVAAAYMVMNGKADAPKYLEGKIDRGDIVIEVGATGTLQPVTLVQVGTQVSGTLMEIHADYNTQVSKGQLLAKLDPSNFQAQLEQAQASLSSAEASRNDTAANVEVLRANLAKSKVDVLDKERKFRRSKELDSDKLISRDDLETAEYTFQAAKATVDAGEAQVKSGVAKLASDEARVVQAKASLEQARVNLEHTIITAPISGTVISRNVDMGQTVAASFSSPTLFTIAADLSKMYLYTNVDEADMARITEGKTAIFNVDAYRGETFHGTITQVRLSPTTVQNVVTYNAIIEVDNRDLKLKPGMTANVKIRVDSRTGVLRVPNAALRFQPDLLTDAERQKMVETAQEEFRTYMRSQFQGRGDTPESAPGESGRQPGSGFEGRRGGGGGGQNPGMAGRGNFGPGGGGPRGSGGSDAQRQRTRPVVWILSAEKSLKPVMLRTGASDGSYTEILAGQLKEGETVVTGTELSAADRSQTPQNPSMRGPGGVGGFMRGIR